MDLPVGLCSCDKRTLSVGRLDRGGADHHYTLLIMARGVAFAAFSSSLGVSMEGD